MTYGTNDTRGRIADLHADFPSTRPPPSPLHRLSHQAEREEGRDIFVGAPDDTRWIRASRAFNIISLSLSLSLSVFFPFFSRYRGERDDPAIAALTEWTWNRARYDCSSRLTAVKSRYIGAAMGIYGGGRDGERRALAREIKSNDNDKIQCKFLPQTVSKRIRARVNFALFAAKRIYGGAGELCYRSRARVFHRELNRVVSVPFLLLSARRLIASRYSRRGNP